MSFKADIHTVNSTHTNNYTFCNCVNAQKIDQSEKKKNHIILSILTCTKRKEGKNAKNQPKAKTNGEKKKKKTS